MEVPGGRDKERIQGEKKKQSKFISFCSSPSVQAGLRPGTVQPLGSDEGV